MWRLCNDNMRNNSHAQRRLLLNEIKWLCFVCENGMYYLEDVVADRLCQYFYQTVKMT